MKAGSVIKINKTNDYKETDLKAYQRLIGKLIYLSYGIRPDIAFGVRQLSKRNADLRVGHLKAAKRVIRYLKGTMQMGIIYRVSNLNPALYRLVEYTDSNYVEDPKDKKSIMSHCFFINGAVVFWYSKK